MSDRSHPLSTDIGLLIIRLGVGSIFIAFGAGKLAGGPEMWAMIGGAMEMFGISFAPTFWGLLASLAEFGGGLCLALGALTRLALIPLAFTMFVAFLSHWGDGLGGFAHALNMMFVFVGLFFVGPGRLSADRFLASKLGTRLLGV